MVNVKEELDLLASTSQLKYFNAEFFDKKNKIEADNMLMEQELKNYQLKAALQQAKKAASGLTTIK